MVTRAPSERFRYTVDGSNRLVLLPADGALRPRRVLDGRFAVKPGNRLVYHVDAQQVRNESVPHAIALDGSWALTREHELALTLHESARPRQTLFLKGALTAADAHGLAFTLDQAQGADGRASQRLSFSGRWQADRRNRLTFLAARADGSDDRLTLQGGWEVGRRHELLYRYRRSSTSQRSIQEHALTFDGSWDVTRANRLAYRLAGSRELLEFAASLRSPSLIAREGRLVYDVGIGVSRGQRRQRVSLTGAWKIGKDLSASFEVPYAGGRIEAIRFEGSYAMTSRDRVAVALRDSRRQPLGLTVIFTRDLLPDAKLFLRLQQDGKETAVLGGVQVRF